MGNTVVVLGLLVQEVGEQGISPEQREQSYSEARHLYQSSLAIEEELGNKAGIATSLYQLGVLAQVIGIQATSLEQHEREYAKAIECYRQSLLLKESLGDQAGIARILKQLSLLEASGENLSKGK